MRIAFLSGTALALALTAGAASATEWDMPMAYAASNYHSELGAAFAERVGEATDGALTITVHPGGSLYGGAEIKRAVQTGQAQIGERLISALANENPIYGLDAVPFLATSFDAAWDLYEASRETMSEILAEDGLMLLYAVPWPPQGLYTQMPVESAADMEGVTFRAYNPATARLAELMGAVPTQVEAAELAQAFATGTVESMVSSGSTGYDRQLWEYTSHWYDVQAWLPKNMVIVNMAAWEGLSDDVQAAVLAVAEEIEAEGWAQAEELSGWYAEQLAANGMTVLPPGDRLRGDLEAIGATMTAEWLTEAGPAGQAVVDAFQGN